ncbi:MAG: hypothetical protein HDS68_01705 [Bacteroidales bacterium]|nr:hypothetical protein [Bacteroidales bacterium]
MKGLIVTFRNRRYSCGLPGGIYGIIINDKMGKVDLNLGGLDSEMLSHDWISNPLAPGDEIRIEFAELSETGLTPAASVYDFTDEDVQNRRMLEEYNILKKELTDEGLLQQKN